MGKFLDDLARGALQPNWVSEPGYTSPNLDRYPWQWLWDSCFHAIAWAHLGDWRAVREMESLFSGMLESGFMPNTLFHAKPRAAWLEWGVFGHSTITQPPMYGHALKVLTESGFDVRHLHAPALKAMHHLIDSRLDAATGLVKVVHPWETGCDDSPRWNRWMPFGYNRKVWNITKFVLVKAMRVRRGEAVGSRLFEVCSASFNALVAWNARELAELTGDETLRLKAESIAAALEGTWNEEARTWCDVSPRTGKVSSSLPTLESFLPLLVVTDSRQTDAAISLLMDETAFRRPWGFAGVLATDGNYRSNGYWRGGCWPQLCYLLALALPRFSADTAETFRQLSVKGIVQSKLSEYWDPETGESCGAWPQGWSAVVCRMAGDEQ